MQTITDKALTARIDGLLVALNEAIQQEEDIERNCRLQDALEHVRRAYFTIEGTPCQFNDLIN